MTFPVSIPFAGLALPPHFVFDLLAYWIGFKLFTHYRSNTEDPLSDFERQATIVAAIGGAAFGATLLGALENPWEFVNPPTLTYYISSRTVVGGLLGGWLAVEGAKALLNIKRSSGDLLVFPLITAMAIGRIGCFLSGVSDQTVGLPSKLPWAFDQGDGVPRHPTALYEILFLVALGCVLSRLESGLQLRDGIRFKYFLSAYCLFRLFAEFLKPAPWSIGGLSTIQIACLLALVYYVARHGRELMNPGKSLLR